VVQKLLTIHDSNNHSKNVRRYGMPTNSSNQANGSCQSSRLLADLSAAPLVPDIQNQINITAHESINAIKEGRKENIKSRSVRSCMPIEGDNHRGTRGVRKVGRGTSTRVSYADLEVNVCVQHHPSTVLLCNQAVQAPASACSPCTNMPLTAITDRAWGAQHHGL